MNSVITAQKCLTEFETKIKKMMLNEYVKIGNRSFKFPFLLLNITKIKNNNNTSLNSMIKN